MWRASLLVIVACSSTEPTRPKAEPARAKPAGALVPHNSNGTRKTFPPSPPDVAGKMHVFRYEDFGPQALAVQLVGMECYGDCCCMEIGDSFDVRVVVYAGVSEVEARARYVNGPETGDYRFVPAAEAKAFVATNLADIEGWPGEDRIPALERTLRATRDRLATTFSAP